MSATQDGYWARVGEFALRIVVMDSVLVPPSPGLDPTWSSFQVTPLTP